MVTAIIPTFDEDDYDTPTTTGRGQTPSYQQGVGGVNALRLHQQIRKTSVGLDKGCKSKQVNVAPPNVIYLMSILSAMGGFLFGYDTGIVSGAIMFFKVTFQLNDLWQEFVVSITVLGAWVFSLLAGSISEKYGRKVVILAASVIFTVGSIVMGFSRGKWVLLLGRFIVGVAVGLASTLVPIYIAEVAPANLRGSLVTLNNCFITFGQLCAAITAGIFSYDKENGWRWMLSIAAIPASLQFIGFMFMPESPRWLIRRRRDLEAMEALQRIRGPNNPNIEREFEMIKQNSSEAEVQKARRKEQNRNILMSILRKRATRRALIVGCLLMAIQQLAGINTFVYYTPTIMEKSGVSSPAMAVWLAVPTATVYMLASIPGYFLADRVGRRALTLGSLLGVIVALLILGTGFHLNSLNSAAVHMHNMSHEPCSTYDNCYKCVRDLSCGFCYDPNDVQSTSICLLKDQQNRTHSEACLKMSDNSNIKFETQHCPSDSPNISLNTWLVLFGLTLYLAAFAPGMGPMPWTINSEIYPMWARGVCYSLATGVNWLFNLVISLTFLSLSRALTDHGAFYLYSIVASIGWLLLFWKLPETKGRSLEEVSSLFIKQKPDNEEIMDEDGTSGSHSSDGGTVIGPWHEESAHSVVVGVDNPAFNGGESPMAIHQSRSFKVQSPLSKVATQAVKTGAIPNLTNKSINTRNNNNNSKSVPGSDSPNYPVRSYSNGRHPEAYFAPTLSTSPDGSFVDPDTLCSGGDDDVVAFMHQKITNNNKRNKQTPARFTKSSPSLLHHNTNTNTVTNTTITNDNNKTTTTTIPTITNTDTTNNDRAASLNYILNDNDDDDDNLGNPGLSDGVDSCGGQLVNMIDYSYSSKSLNDNHHYPSSPTCCGQLYSSFANSKESQQRQPLQHQLRSSQPLQKKSTT